MNRHGPLHRLLFFAVFASFAASQILEADGIPVHISESRFSGEYAPVNLTGERRVKREPPS